MSIGLDPEFFVVDGGHHIVPAEKFLDSAEGDVAFDNAAVEIRPYQSTCIQGFLGNVRETFHHAVMKMRLARLQGRIPRSSHISLAPAARLRQRDMTLPSVQQFGCSPSLMVEPDGSLTQTTAKVDPLGFAYRSAGYHVHVASGSRRDETFTTATQLADVFVGLVDVMMVAAASPSWIRGSQIRREVMGYGRAGEHRVRQVKAASAYGTGFKVWEYRTLSPWPLSHPLWSWWAQSAVRHCMRVVATLNPVGLNRVLAPLPNRSEVVEAINSCDATEARRLWLAAVNATGGLEGRDGNDALTMINLRKLLYALDNRGYETFTAGWSPERAWFRNIMPSTERYSGKAQRTPRQSLRNFLDNQRRGSYGGYENVSTSPKHYNLINFTRHEEGKITTFPTGVDNYFDLIEGRRPTLPMPELPNA